MFDHFKKSASILTDQDTQIVGNDRWQSIICNNADGFFKCSSLPWTLKKKKIRNNPIFYICVEAKSGELELYKWYYW